MFNRAKRAGEVLLGRDDDATPTPADVHAVFTSRMEEAERIVERLEAELAKAVRIKGEYFGLIEKMEHQRDEWRELYHRQSSAHHNAQVMLEGYLTQTREWLKKAILIINQVRKEQNEPLIQKPGDLDATAPPIGTAAEYKRAMDVLTAGAEPLLDAKLERDKLDEDHAKHYAVMCTCGHARIQHATEDRNCVFEEGCTCEKFEAAT
jgi:hypothetical protein